MVLPEGNLEAHRRVSLASRLPVESRSGPVRRVTRSSTTSAESDRISLTGGSRSAKRSRCDPAEAESAAQETGSGLVPPKTESTEAPPKKRRRAKGDYSDLDSDPLTDRIREGLDVLFCGENPGIRTAQRQLHCESCRHPSICMSRTSPIEVRLNHVLGSRCITSQPLLQGGARCRAHARGSRADRESDVSRRLQHWHHELDPATDNRGWPRVPFLRRYGRLTVVFCRPPSSRSTKWKRPYPSSYARSWRIVRGEHVPLIGTISERVH